MDGSISTYREGAERISVVLLRITSFSSTVVA